MFEAWLLTPAKSIMEMSPSSPLSILMFNQSWFQKELEARGHKVFSLSLSSPGCNVLLPSGGIHISELHQFLPKDFNANRLIYWDDSTIAWLGGLEELQLPKLFYSVDVHHHNRWHSHFSAIFDKVFVAQKDFISGFLPYSPEASWLPLWAHAEALPEMERDLGAVFVGTIDDRVHPKRREFFEAIRSYVPIDVRQGGYLDLYGRAKIVLNQVVNGDLNFRVFEAMECGALLVTPKIGNGLLDIFEEGVDLVCYEDGDPEDAARKISYYLENEDLRKKIADNGRNKVRRFHSITARTLRLEEELFNLFMVQKSHRQYGAAFSYMVGFLTCEHENIAWGEKLLAPARRAMSLAQALSGREEIGAALIIAEFTSRREGPEKALTFLEQLKRSNPGSRAIKAAVIQQLLKADRRESAFELAKEFTSDVENLCKNIDAVLSQEIDAS